MNKLIKQVLFVAILTFIVLFNTSTPHAQTAFDTIFKKENKYTDVVVQKIINTNEIVIKNYLKKGERIKLIGLKGLEIKKRTNEEPVRDKRTGMVKQHKKETSYETTVEENGLRFVTNLLLGQHVRLEFDTLKKDDDRKTLAYVFLKDTNLFVNEAILENGFAFLQIKQPNSKYSKDLRKAYREGRRQKRGLQNE